MASNIERSGYGSKSYKYWKEEIGRYGKYYARGTHTYLYIIHIYIIFITMLSKVYAIFFQVTVNEIMRQIIIGMNK